MADTQDESLMQKIQALIAPPQSSPAQKQKTKKVKGNNEKSNQIRQENNPFCDACGEGGSLLCCDNCPSSFHFFCCDPPVDPKNLPSGDWLCRRCHPLPVSSKLPHLFGPLLEQASTANPLEFSLPVEMQKYDVFPGVSRKLLSKKVSAPLQDGDTRELYCYACNRGARVGSLVSCDFCPLVFHLDCVHPPLSTYPTSVWMCPVHAEHMMPGFDHPRLTERLRALSESRVTVSYQNVKLDFLTKVNRIPHYKRLTQHHNRRAAEVPEAIKVLYAFPLLDQKDEKSSLSLSLLTQAELVNYHRWEEQQMRKKFVTSREPAVTAVQDDWTRGAILCQLEHSVERAATSKDPLRCTLSSHCGSNFQSHNLETTLIDAEALSAAQGLVELSQKVHLPNGVTKVVSGSDKGSPESDPMEDQSTCNRRTCDSNSGECGERGFNQSAIDVDDGREVDHGSSRDSVETGVSKYEGSSLDRSSPELDEEEEDMDTSQIHFVPDISSLDPHLIKLLATQRLQQLFVASQGCSSALPNVLPPTPHLPPPSPHIPSPSCPSSSLPRQPNGLKTIDTEHRPQTHYDYLSRAAVILCPVSGVGSPRGLNTTVTRIGLSPEMDICLKDYGHCNYVSSQHACIFYDKVADEYELINYSDHGSFVDGVLLCCNFTERHPPEPPPVLTIDAIVARGHGLRAERALLRLEAAREALDSDKEKAKKVLEKVLSLPYRSPMEPDTSSTSSGGVSLGVKRGQDATNSTPNTPTMKTRKMASRKSATKNGEVVAGSIASTAAPSTAIDGTLLHTASCDKTSTTEDMKSSDVSSGEKIFEAKPHVAVNQPQPSRGAQAMGVLNHVESRAKLQAKQEVEPEFCDTEQSNHQPCLCRHSPSILVGSTNKGWEGTALLHHGSRVRFGCLQFVLSMAGKPGHSELVQAFTELLAANSL